MTKTMKAEPFDFEFDPETTALVLIDFQRDFVEPHGFGEALGNDVSLLRSSVEPAARVLAAAREHGMMVIHTREGHRPDLTDCPPAKLTRGGTTFIGTEGSSTRSTASRSSTSPARVRSSPPTSNSFCEAGGSSR